MQVPKAPITRATIPSDTKGPPEEVSTQ